MDPGCYDPEMKASALPQAPPSSETTHPFPPPQLQMSTWGQGPPARGFCGSGPVLLVTPLQVYFTFPISICDRQLR